MFYKNVSLVTVLVVFLYACGGGDPSSENDARPLLALDSNNASLVAISTLEDIDYFQVFVIYMSKLKNFQYLLFTSYGYFYD